MTIYLDRQHPVPVYLQLKELLQSQIEQGEYRSHQQLPSERYLCEQYDLSRMTARRALQVLIAEGWAYTRAGKGTFVSHNPIAKIRTPHVTAGLENGKDSLDSYQTKLIERLTAFNCVDVEQAIKQLLAHYPLELVVTELFPALVRQLEQEWQQENISLLVQSYGNTTIRSHLIALINATSHAANGPRVVLASAPGDHHEIGLLVLWFVLRRRGYLVTYLGSNTTITQFDEILEVANPQLICLSAATQPAATILVELSQRCQTVLQQRQNGHGKPHAVFTFGGPAFSQNPALIPQVVGSYLGNTLDLAITAIERLLPI